MPQGHSPLLMFNKTRIEHRERSSPWNIPANAGYSHVKGFFDY